MERVATQDSDLESLNPAPRVSIRTEKIAVVLLIIGITVVCFDIYAAVRQEQLSQVVNRMCKSIIQSC